MVLSITLGHLAEVVHLASTAHELCPEHGVIEDVPHAAHARSPAVDRHGATRSKDHSTRPLWTSTQEEHAERHAHDGCDVTLIFPSLASYAKPASRPIAPSPVLQPLEPAAPTALTLPRYRLAPKTSPPLSA